MHKKSVWLAAVYSVIVLVCAAASWGSFELRSNRNGRGIWGGCGDVQAGTIAACKNVPTCSGFEFDPCIGHCNTCPQVVPAKTKVGTKDITVLQPACPGGTRTLPCEGIITCSCTGAAVAFNCGTYTENTAAGTCAG